MSSSQIHLSPLYNVLLIRYGEIALKSQQVRKRLLRSLMRNIRYQCTRDNVQFTRLWRDHGFVYLHPEKGHMKKAVCTGQKVLGVHSISPAIYTQGDLETIHSTAVNLAKESFSKGNTFGIRARRVGQHAFSSNEVAKSTGARILEELGEELDLSVNLSQPDKWIHINVRDTNIFVYSESIPTIWKGNPIESFSSGGIMLVNGHVSEFVSGMLVMRRGANIFPVVFSDSLSKDEKIHATLSKFKDFLPIRSFYFLKLKTSKIYEKFEEIAQKYAYPPLTYLLKRRFQILIGTWLVQNHKSLFMLYESDQRIDWNSNIASHLSNKQQKSQIRGKPRALIDYVSIIEGNHPFSYYSPKIPLLQHIEASPIPILRAAITFTSKEIIETFQKIHPDLDKYIDSFADTPEISQNSNNESKIVPFTLQEREAIPEVIMNDFNKLWNDLSQELEFILRDHTLYGDATIGSLENFELVKL